MNTNTSELYAVADFCLIPMGTPNPSVAEEIAECQRILHKSGLKYKMHGYGTNIGSSPLPYPPVRILTPLPEGPWSQVSDAIRDCHAAVHAKGIPRIATDIRIGTRVDRTIPEGEGNDGKVRRVQDILANDASS